MNLNEIQQSLSLKLLTDEKTITNVSLTGCYVSDMLSCVMAGAKKGEIWVTLQSHINIVAVAELLDLAGIIVTENNIPDAAVLNKANEENIAIFSTEHSNYWTAGNLWNAGLTME